MCKKKDMANFLKSDSLDLLESVLVEGSYLRNKCFNVLGLHNEQYFDKLLLILLGVLKSFIISHTGTWLQVKKDNIKDMFGRLELYLSQKVHFVIISGLVVTYKGLNRFRKVISTYLDLVTDILLLWPIFSALEGTIYDDNTSFAYQVRNILLLSIGVPLLLSAFMTVSLTPLVILRSSQWKKSTESKFELAMTRLFTLCIFPLLPAILIINKEKAKDQQKSLKTTNVLMHTSVLEECQLLEDYINEITTAQLIFKQNELSLELIVQMSVHLTMLLLSQTKYPRESGLQSIFQESKGPTTTWWYWTGLQNVFKKIEEKYNTNLVFLILSVVWSFKTCAKTSIKIKQDTMNFLPMFPNILLFCRYMFVYMIRVVCIVSYYAPFIGQLDILNHYQAETIHLDHETWKRFNKSLFQFWNPIEEDFQEKNISDLFRSDYSDPKSPLPPPSTIYTIITLGTATGLFVTSYVLYGLFLSKLKAKMNTDFSSSSLRKKMQHLIHVVLCPEAFQDWDTGNPRFP